MSEPTWHGKTSLHRVFPAWQAVQALRTIRRSRSVNHPSSEPRHTHSSESATISSSSPSHSPHSTRATWDPAGGAVALGQAAAEHTAAVAVDDPRVSYASAAYYPETGLLPRRATTLCASSVQVVVSVKGAMSISTPMLGDIASVTRWRCRT